MKIQLKNVSKKYDSVEILRELNFEIDGITTLGIIGESGCGKSTLLRQLAGIEDPNYGDILINGVSPIENKQEFQNEIGYVFQKHNLFPHLSVRKNIMLILEKIKKIPIEEAEKRVNQVLAKLRIEEEADKKPNQISGGQAQRASIARALATNPKLIFLDEPTAALDPLLTEEVLKSVKELKDTGIEFIFITHEIEFLKEFADYVIFMDKGQIVESGSKECLLNPKTDELRMFLRI